MSEDDIKRVYEIHSLPIENIYGDGSHLITSKVRKPKPYVSPYAKFDKFRKKRK